MLDVKYVKMPISVEEKKEYHRQGFRVVDIRFSPEGHDAPVEEEKKPRKSKAKTESV